MKSYDSMPRLEDGNGVDIIKLCEQVFNSNERVNAERIWSEIVEFTMPNQFGIFKYAQLTPGTKNTVRIFDTIGVQCVNDLSSILHFMITGPVSKWTQLEMQTENLKNNINVKKWFDWVSDQIQEEINNSNFNTEAAMAYKFFVSIGNMILRQSVKRHDDGSYEKLHFQSMHPAYIGWTRKDDGDINEVFRRFKLTAGKAYDKWGEKCPKCVIAAAQANQFTEYWFYEYICTRDKKQVKYNSVGKSLPHRRPIRSVYVCEMGGDILEENGYYRMVDVITPCERMPTEDYGRGPGHCAIPEIKTVNRYREVDLTARSFAAQPPILTMQRNIIGVMKYSPGELWTLRNPDPNSIRPWDSGAKFDINMEGIQQSHQEIAKLFYLDKLLLSQRETQGGVSPAQFAEYKVEAQRVLGPIVGRLEADFIAPIVESVFYTLLEEGRLHTTEHPIPAELRDKNGKFKNIKVSIKSGSALSHSQNREAIAGVMQLLQIAHEFVNLGRPEAMDKINVDEAMNMTIEGLSLPVKLAATEQQIQQSRQQRAQQAQQMQQSELNLKQADAASKMAKANGVNRPQPAGGGMGMPGQGMPGQGGGMGTPGIGGMDNGTGP